MITRKMLAGIAATGLALGTLAQNAGDTPAAAQGGAAGGKEGGAKIKIFCDMEGISGVLSRFQANRDHPLYAEGQRYLMGDLNACIEGCFAGGATTVAVQDIHWTCENIVWDKLDGRVACTKGLTSRFEGIEAFDGLILLGYHAMAGTPKAILAHTSSQSWKNCWLNGQKVGEFALEAARAGEHGVPVIMTSGDDMLCKEGKSLLPDIVAVEVKKAAAWEAGILLPQPVAHQKIREGAAEAVRKLRISKPKPYIVATPVTVRLELVKPTILPSGPNIKIINQRTYEATAETALKAINFLL